MHKNEKDKAKQPILHLIDGPSVTLIFQNFDKIHFRSFVQVLKSGHIAKEAVLSEYNFISYNAFKMYFYDSGHEKHNGAEASKV